MVKSLSKGTSGVPARLVISAPSRMRYSASASSLAAGVKSTWSPSALTDTRPDTSFVSDELSAITLMAPGTTAVVASIGSENVARSVAPVATPLACGAGSIWTTLGTAGRRSMSASTMSSGDAAVPSTAPDEIGDCLPRRQHGETSNPDRLHVSPRLVREADCWTRTAVDGDLRARSRGVSHHTRCRRHLRDTDEGIGSAARQPREAHVPAACLEVTISRAAAERGQDKGRFPVPESILRPGRERFSIGVARCRSSDVGAIRSSASAPVTERWERAPTR